MKEAFLPNPKIIDKLKALVGEKKRAQAVKAAPAPTAPVVIGDRIGRNDPCPCGSGKKYKKCHLPLGGYNP